MAGGPKTKILLVDDRADGLITLEAVLKSTEYQLISASSGSEALKKLIETDVAVILMDVQMPGMDGFETASRIRQEERFQHIPIIFVTGVHGDPRSLHYGYDLGAVDYITKPYDPYVLKAKVRMLVDLFQKTVLLAEKRKGEEEKTKILALEREARFRAEREKARLEFLDDVSRILCGSLDYESSLKNLTRLLVPKLCDWCAIHLLEPPHHIRQVSVAHIETSKLASAWELDRKYPIRQNAPHGPGKVIRTGEFELHQQVSDEVLKASATDEEHLTTLRKLRLSSALIVPLTAESTTIGALTLVSCDCGPVFSQEDVTFVQEIGHRAALTIHNARLFQDMKEYARRLEAANRELEQFNFVSSHDLKEPLRMVKTYVQLLKKRYRGKLDKEADEYIGFADEGANRLVAQIDALLEYSRLSSLELKGELVDCNEALKRALSNLRLSPKDLNALTFDKLPLVEGDERQLTKLFENLLSNAFKFRRGNPPKIHVGAEKKENEWVFQVSDNGIGIDPQFMGKLFVIFQRLNSREKYPGTGIGLALCRKILEHHGGKIWVTSEVGGGATFYFTLPTELPERRPAPSLPSEIDFEPAKRTVVQRCQIDEPCNTGGSAPRGSFPRRKVWGAWPGANRERKFAA